MAVTIRDVAARAGVSTATVSRALHGNKMIAVATRLRVAAAAAELGYILPTRERAAADSPLRHRVAMLVPYVGRWYFARLLEGAERVMQSRGVDLIVSRPADQQGHRRSIADHVKSLQLSGVITADLPVTANDVAALRAEGVPLVIVGAPVFDVPSVGIDDVHAGYIAARHLLNQGHTRIGLVTEGLHEWGYSSAHLRSLGFHAAMSEVGETWDRNCEVHADFTVRGAQQAVEALFALPDPPTAILVHSDEMALGVMAAARSRGLRIPAELSIIGIDDHEMAGAHNLTTVAQPVDSLGEIAAMRMLLLLDGGSMAEPMHLTVPTQLVDRGSVVPPRG